MVTAQQITPDSDLVTSLRHSIRLRVRVRDWRHAIQEAGALLLRAGAIEMRYIEAMIAFCEKYDSYIVLVPGIALAHARPEDGARKVGFSLITLATPVNFGHPTNDPVGLVLAMAAPDPAAHVQALAQLAEVLQDDERVRQIREARRVAQVLQALRSAPRR